MPTIDDSCKSCKKDIEKWLVSIEKKLDDKDCPLTDEQKKEIKEKLPKVKILCKECEPKKAARTDWEKGEITLCLNQPDFLNEVTLFHELVHACGGKDAGELDAEALENNCYKQGKGGATVPDGDDHYKMIRWSFLWEKEFYCGKYVIWNPLTGEKWVNEGTKKKPKKGKDLKKNAELSKEKLDEIKKKIEADRKAEKEKKEAEKKSEQKFILSEDFKLRAAKEKDRTKKKLFNEMASHYLDLSKSFKMVAKNLDRVIPKRFDF